MLSQRPVEVPKTLLARAQAYPPVVAAVVNAGHRMVMEAAREAMTLGLMHPVLVGNRAAIARCADELEWDVSGLHVEGAGDEQQAAERAVSLVRQRQAAALVKGDIHTDVLLKTVIHRRHGLLARRPLSHLFHLTFPDIEKPLWITDAVLNVSPNVRKKTRILRNAVDVLHTVGVACPKVAVLSASEVPRQAMPSSLDARDIVQSVRSEAWPNVEVQGPLALDLAISGDAAQIKHVDGPVVGQADLLLVPNIETGNALFKALVYFRSAAAAGIVVGARAPILLTSRADPAAARIASAALLALYVGALED